MEPKSAYLTRALIALIILMAPFAVAGLEPFEKQTNIFVTLGLFIVLAIYMGGFLSRMIGQATGMTFFLSGTGLIIFYIITMILAPFLAPVFILWNLFKYFTAEKSQEA
jgi:carbon starvation protein CstA